MIVRVNRVSFVACMFVMAVAALGLAAIDVSWKWLIGGIVLLGVALFALQRLRVEDGSGQAGPGLWLSLFIGVATIAILLWAAALAHSPS